MDKQKIMSVLKSIVIILVIVCFVAFLRFQAGEIAAISSDQKAMFKDSDGLPYFTEMDSYYNLRMTQDYMDYGHMGDIVKANGTPWDTLSYAPDGRSADYRPMIAYVTSFLYQIANMFTNMSLKEVAFYTSAIIAPLAAIPAYIIVRRLTNDYGGITAALIVSLAPNYFSHTFAGFFDTDMFNVIIPLFMILIFLESIKSDKFIYRLIFAILTVLSMVAFSLSWDGYSFYIALLVLVMIAYLILGFIFKLDLIKPIKNYPNIGQWLINQREIFAIVFIAVVGIIGLSLTNGFDSVIGIPAQLLGATELQSAATASAFPNVAISIAELQVPNLLYGGIGGAFSANSGGIINGVGGIVAIFGAFIILILLAQRLWNLRSVRTGKDGVKKPPKGQRRSASKVKESKERTSLIDSTFEDVRTLEDVNKSKRETLLYLTLFGVWIAISAVAVTQGSRFIQVLMIPLGLCVGLFVGYAVVYIKNKVDNKNTLFALSVGGSLLVLYPLLQTFTIFAPLFKLSATIAFAIPIIIFILMIGIAALLIYGVDKIKGLSSSKFAKTAVMVIITLAIITPTVFGAYQVSESVVPSTSDPMWNSMLWAKANTTENSTMASWWDFGYLFEIASDRPTIFDGGSQTGIRAFWTGKAMTTNDTNLSAAIFEMLAYSGDRASEQLDNYTNNSGKTAEILQKTLTQSKEEAKTTMTDTYKLSSAQADKIINMTHPDNPTPVVFVASSDMLQKAGWWTYFGNWDFDIKNSSGYQYMVAEQPVKMKNISQNKSQANITNMEDQGILYQTVVTKGVENNTTNATTQAVYANGSKVMTQNNTTYNPFIINRMLVIEDNIVWKNETVNASGNYTLLLMGNNGTYTSVLMSKELENSMFTKLFILGGFGQDSYELIHMDNGISLWQIKGIDAITEDAKNNVTSNSTNNTGNSSANNNT